MPPICMAVRLPFVRQYFWESTGGFPDLLFLAVLEEQGKPTKTARIRSRGRAPKILRKQAKNAQKSKDFLEKKKARKSKMARKRRSGLGNRNGRAPKYRTKGCSHYSPPKFTARKWLKCCKNQCSRSRAVSERAWTPFCVILWRWLTESSWSKIRDCPDQLQDPRAPPCPSFPWCFSFLGVFLPGNFLGPFECFLRRRTNVQQLTCKIDLSNSFYYLFFSFVLLELKPLFWRGKSWGKNYEKVWKSVKNYEKLWNDFAL